MRLSTRPLILAMAIAISAAVGFTLAGQASISAQVSKQADTATGDPVSTLPPRAAESWFAKYDGIDGESKDDKHATWIDVLSIDWGMHRPGGGMTGQSRRRGAAVVEDVTLTIEYEKASPKLQEKLLKGEIIPKLEIEQTATYGGARAVYLKYELKNVMITSISVNGAAEDGPPQVVVGNNFEEIKVTYTEYDDTGSNKGNVEYNWKVEKGAK